MFGIDFSEILVIFGIALVVLGPERLPKLAATIGRWIGRARAMARQFKDQLEQETSHLQHGVDLGPEFGGHPTSHTPTSSTPTIRPVAASGSPQSAPAPQAVPPGAAATATPTAVPAPHVDNFGLADTYPAALNDTSQRPPAATIVPSEAGGTGVPGTSGNGIAPSAAAPSSDRVAEPHQQALWPPDGPS